MGLAEWIIDDTCLVIYYCQEYIHRVGRTARGEGGKGRALLILSPEELGFKRYLQQAKVPLNEFEFEWSKVSNIQPQVSWKLWTLFIILSLSHKILIHSHSR